MPGGITGDSSARWFMDVDDARPGFTKINSHQGVGGRGLRHEGIFETGGGYFEISIEIPKDTATRPTAQDDFANALLAAATLAKGAPSGTRVTIPVPIQDRQSGYPVPDANTPLPNDQYQITIDWP
jgi:hypothetical protein